MKTTQITKAIEGKMYSFNSRYSTKEDAREKAQKLNGEKHSYYTKITEKGVEYFDVRTEN